MADNQALEGTIIDGIPIVSGIPDQKGFGAGTMQQVKTTYNTAVSVQKPRDIKVVQDRVLKEARLAGASVFYSWDVKLKTGGTSVITGASIDLAMTIARNYGNCAIEVESYETDSHFVIKGVFIDLETGFTVPRIFRQRKSQKAGDSMDAERQQDIAFQIGQSKAQRNAILKAMPGWLIDQCIQEGRDGEKERASGKIPQMAAEAIRYFTSKGATLDRMEKKLGKSKNWTADDIVDLKGMATALKENRATVDELFPDDVVKETHKKEPAAKKETVKKQDPPQLPPDPGSEPDPEVKKQPPKKKTEGAQWLTDDHKLQLLDLCTDYGMSYTDDIQPRLGIALDETMDSFFSGIVKVIHETATELGKTLKS